MWVTIVLCLHRLKHWFLYSQYWISLQVPHQLRKGGRWDTAPLNHLKSLQAKWRTLNLALTGSLPPLEDSSTFRNTVGVILFIHEISVSSHPVLARKVCLLLFGFLGSWSSWFSSKWQHWKLLSGGYFTGSTCMYSGNDLMLQAGSEAVIVVTQ